MFINNKQVNRWENIIGSAKDHGTLEPCHGCPYRRPSGNTGHQDCA